MYLRLVPTFFVLFYGRNYRKFPAVTSIYIISSKLKLSYLPSCHLDIFGFLTPYFYVVKAIIIKNQSDPFIHYKVPSTSTQTHQLHLSYWQKSNVYINVNLFTYRIGIAGYDVKGCPTVQNKLIPFEQVKVNHTCPGTTKFYLFFNKHFT